MQKNGNEENYFLIKEKLNEEKNVKKWDFGAKATNE